MTIAEGDAVILFAQDGRVLDQGNVLAVNPDRTRALIRWTAPGGLRTPTWTAITDGLRRVRVAA